MKTQPCGPLVFSRKVRPGTGRKHPTRPNLCFSHRPGWGGSIAKAIAPNRPKTEKTPAERPDRPNPTDLHPHAVPVPETDT